MPHDPEMRLPYLFLFLLASACAAAAPVPDSTEGAFGLQARASYGFLIAHRPNLRPLQERHLRAMEFSYLLTTDGSARWQQDFLFPEKGVQIALFDLGNAERLGMGLALYPFLDFPLTRQRDWKWRLRYGMGLGYVQRNFDPVNNYKNAAIGSRLNGVIHFDLHVRKNIGRGAAEAGLAITHFSNGATAMPNLGINLATAHLGYLCYFGEKSPRNRIRTEPVCGRSWFTLFGSGSWKEIYPPLGRKYFAASVSGDWFVPLSTKIDGVLGADLFYDSSLRTRMEATEGSSQPVSTNLRPGIHTGIQVLVGKLGLLFNLGYYPYTRFKEDGAYFHRIGFRYYFPKLIAVMNLKTHYARADFVEWGLGWRFGKTNSTP